MLKLAKMTVVYSDAELSIAVNRIERYIDLLTECLSDYANAVHDLEKNQAFVDQKATAKFNEMADKASGLITDLDAVRTEIGKVRQAYDGLEELDNFEFPDGFFAALQSMLSVFGS